jgi:hypothetical protein
VFTETDKSRLTALMEQPGPNRIKELFAAHNPGGFERLYGPGPIERIKRLIESLLMEAPHTEHKVIYVNSDSPELKMLAELLTIDRAAARQLAIAMGQRPVLEVDIRNMRHKITFRRLEP